jgi:FtsP/CotA-like multicopper oxidase with cupredoxin domain
MNFILVLISNINAVILYLEIRNESLADLLLPNLSKRVITVNGTSPGPVINVQANQQVEVVVRNVNVDDGIAIHWHGMVQNGTAFSDGVPGLSQCVIAVNHNVTYKFKPTTVGTFWYHGHYMSQYVDGLLGALIVHDSNVDQQIPDDTTFVIQDYFHHSARQLLNEYYLTKESHGCEPPPDAIVVNGQLSSSAGARHQSSRNNTSRLRFIAASTLSMFRISIDFGAMVLVELDATSIVPMIVGKVILSAGQRASVLIDWRSVPLHVSNVTINIDAILDMYDEQVFDSNGVPVYENDVSSPLYIAGAKALNANYTTSVILLDDDTAGATLLNTATIESSCDDVNQLCAQPVDAMTASDATHFLYTEMAFYANNDGVIMPQYAWICCMRLTLVM